MKQTFRSLVVLPCLTALLVATTTASADTFTFATDPFEGSDALTTPGRQVVGGESFINFNIGSDVFEFAPGVFDVGGSLTFANDVIGNIPAAGAEVIVLQTFNNPFGAGSAADLIAGQVTSPGAGFFVYFNSGLDLPRLVYSTDLNDNDSDLKILARLTNLGGQPGRDAMATFTESNFRIAAVPEPASTLTLLLSAGALLFAGCTLRQR